MNKILVAASSALLLAAACGDVNDATVEQQETPRPEPVGVIASDALSGLPSTPTGIDFWTHPNVAFNSLIIVASADGLSSYNVEDGSPVSSAPGFAYQGVAVSYIGFGPLAAGIVAAYNEADGAFDIYGVDNASRLFLPLDGGPTIRGAVRGYCIGRADSNPDPTLFVVQKGELTILNVTPSIDGDTPGVAVNGETGMTIPDTITACAVDTAGVVYLLADDGEIYRIDSDRAFAAPFAIAYADNPGGMVFLGSAGGDASSVSGQIAVLDGENGLIELFDASDGHALGAARIDAGDEIDAVTHAVAIGGSAANLGGLYRDGAIALGVDGDAPAVRLAPANGVANALGVPPLPPANPRGVAPTPPETDDLIIDFEPPATTEQD